MMRTEAEVWKAVKHLERTLTGAIRMGNLQAEEQAAHLLDCLEWVLGSERGTFAAVIEEWDQAEVETLAIREEMAAEGGIQ